MDPPRDLSDALERYRNTARGLEAASGTWNAMWMAQKVVPWILASGDLAVTGIEELARVMADYRRAEEARRAAAEEKARIDTLQLARDRRTQNIVLGLGLMFAAIAAGGSVAQAYGVLRSPPQLQSVAAPLSPQVAPQSPQAPTRGPSRQRPSPE